MLPADFWYVLVKTSFQNMKGKNMMRLENQDQNWLKSKRFANLIDSISAIMNFENTILCYFVKLSVNVLSEAFCECSYVCPILSHFHQPIKIYSHLKFWSARFGSAFYQFFRLLCFGNRKRSETKILAASSTHWSLRHITKWSKSKALMVPPRDFLRCNCS